MRVGFLHSLIRKDEKLLIAELRGRAGIELVFLDDRRLVFDFHARPRVDVVLERSINHSRAMHALRLFEGAGTPCVNSYEVSRRCGDKILTAASLAEQGVPQPEARVAFTPESTPQQHRRHGREHSGEDRVVSGGGSAMIRVSIAGASLATCHVFLDREVDEKALWRIYRSAYAAEPFVRIVKERAGVHR